MIKIDKIVGYDQSTICQREKEYNVEKEPDIVELQKTIDCYGKLYWVYCAIMLGFLGTAVLLEIIQSPYIVIAQIILVILGMITLFKLPSLPNKQLKSINQQILLRKAYMADMLFDSFVGDREIKSCMMISQQDEYCSMRVTVEDIDSNIDEIEILFNYKESDDVQQYTLDINDRTLYCPKTLN